MIRPITPLILALMAPCMASAYELASPSEEADGFFGYSVSGLPDVTGDGLGDLIISAPNEAVYLNPNSGQAYVFNGVTGRHLLTLNVAFSSLSGVGLSVCGLADIDGDARGDAYVSPRLLFNCRTGALIRQLTPPATSDFGFGRSSCPVPDITGDGVNDLIIGDPTTGPSPSPLGAGRAYAFNPVTGALVFTLASPNEEDSGRFGVSVSGMADANGDSIPDLIVGAGAEDPGATPPDAGRAYVFSGATGALLHQLVSPSETAAGNFGDTVSGVPDLNSDGRGDIVVGAWQEGASPCCTGNVHIFSGATGAPIRTIFAPSGLSGGSFGRAVAGMADVNGDGQGDALAGADFDGGAATGHTYSISGGSGALIATHVSGNPENSGRFGFSVAAVPDIDGDGKPEALVGAVFESPGSSPARAGRAYLFSPAFGSPIATPVPTPPPNVALAWDLYE